ncbi:hypothetical protein ACF1BU_07310 [Streptomyces sp. NPDC014724]|uniref:hypothetical protein n=1 Tax=unclassified Streptomyces TaxID=2593676 RepID=UPI0036F957A1
MTHASHHSPVVPGASRRALLRGIGIIGGAGAMFATTRSSASPPSPGRPAVNPPFRCRELGVPIEVFTDMNVNVHIFDGKAGARAPVRRRTAGHVHFAGDHLGRTDAWRHGAFTSARKAATALHARVLA